MIEFLLHKYHGVSKSHYQYSQLSIVFISIISCTAIAAFFCFYNRFIDYYPPLFYVDLVGTLIGLVSLLFFLYLRWVQVASFVLVLMVTGVCLTVVLTLNNEGYSLAWAFVTPLLSVFLLGFLYGALYSALYLVVVASIAYSNLGQWQPAPWNMDSFITVLALYLLLFMLSCYYESSRRAAQTLLEATNDKLTVLATTDPLTGLYNRRYMEDLLLNSKSDIYIAMADVDNFKGINDTFGHTVGDEVLVGLSQVLQEFIGDRGVVGRWGGEEFIIAVHDVCEEGFEAQMNELLARISSHSFNIGRPVTLSLGGVRHCADEHRVALRSVDEALYCAKMAGKDCFKFVEPLA